MGWLSNLFGGGGTEQENDTDRESDSDAGKPVASPDVDPSQYDAAILFQRRPEVDETKLREMAEAAGIMIEELARLETGLYEVETPGSSLGLSVVPEPYPDELADRQLLPAEFPRDRAHIGISVEGPDALEQRDEHRTPETYPDPWGPDGAARQVTRLARALVEEDGLAVALSRAGGLLVPAQQFLSLSEGLEDPGHRPFEAWLHLSRAEEGAPLETQGLAMFGLPELSVHFDHEDDYWRARRELEAVKYAAARMIHENRVLGAAAEGEGRFGFEPIEAFAVPLGVEAGAEMPSFDDEPEAVHYRVELEEDQLTLRSDGEATIWDRWSTLDETEEVGLPAYQALFQKSFSEAIDQTPDVSIEVDAFPEMEPFDCDVYRSGESPMTLMVTNGLGRREFAADADGGETRRVELAVRTARDGGPILDVVANVAAGLALDDETFAPGDTVHFEEPLYGLQYFLLAEFLELRPTAQGPPVGVWQLVPLSGDEYDAIDRDGGEAWLREHDPGDREFAERWARALQ